MTPQSVLDELQALASELEGDVEKVERRIATAQATRDALLKQLAATRETINLYRERHRLPAPELSIEIDEALRTRWANGSTKDMAVDIARMSGGRLKIRAAAQALAQAGMFKDKDNAASNLYATATRNSQLFEKVAPGEFVLREPANAPTPDAVEHAQLEFDPPPSALVPFRPPVQDDVLVERA